MPTALSLAASEVPYVYPTFVRKTSVYLTEELKAALAALAGRSQRSEADLIRLAVERLVHGGAPALPVGERVAPVRPKGEPRIVAVGVGPGDPDLLTDRARQVLRTADRIFSASMGTDAIARAEMIVRSALPEVTIDRLPIIIADDADRRALSMSSAARALVDAVDAGNVVAFITLGDPNLYTAYPAIARSIAATRPDIVVESVPGIMAFQELAARTGTVVAEGDEHVVMVSAADAPSLNDAVLDDPHCTVVVYKGGRHLPELADGLRGHDRLHGAVMGEMLGLAGGRSVPVAGVADRPASYLATVIVPAVRAPMGSPVAGVVAS